MRCRDRIRKGLALCFALLVLGRLQSSAQAATEYQVKAAYLYNFAKFVDWPAQNFASPTAPIRLCVFNAPSFEPQLSQIVQGKTVGGRPISVVPVRDREQFRTCHILFIDSSQNGKSRQIIEMLRTTSVLTVGETKGFLEQGGIINFILQDDRVHFQVNHRAAKEAGLRISARLLGVAKSVVE